MEAPGSFGWGGAYGTSYKVDPTSGLVVVLMILVQKIAALFDMVKTLFQF